MRPGVVRIHISREMGATGMTKSRLVKILVIAECILVVILIVMATR
jgi:hypothetical protein